MRKVSMQMNSTPCVIDNVRSMVDFRCPRFSFSVIQHLILEGRTTDAIEKTKELFPTLLNDKNLLFVLKVRQFIEMVNGTESEIQNTCTSNLPSTSSQPTTTTANNLLAQSKARSNSPSCSSSAANKNSSGRSSSPMTKTNTSSRSRSNSPYVSGRTQTTTTSGAQHSNGTVNSSSRRSSANNTNEGLSNPDD